MTQAAISLAQTCGESEVLSKQSRWSAPVGRNSERDCRLSAISEGSRGLPNNPLSSNWIRRSFSAFEQSSSTKNSFDPRLSASALTAFQFSSAQSESVANALVITTGMSGASSATRSKAISGRTEFGEVERDVVDRVCVQKPATCRCHKVSCDSQFPNTRPAIEKNDHGSQQLTRYEKAYRAFEPER
jgi:hypothetical protein